jgi:phosphoglycolate phosphatase
MAGTAPVSASAPVAQLAPRRYRLVVFDWDGTLADSTTMIAEAIRSACADIGCAVPDMDTARYVIGLGLAESLSHVAPDLPVARYADLAARYRHHYLARDADIPLFDGARALLEDMHAAGFRLAVATGKTRVGLDRALAHHGVARHFHATRCADEGRPKPHPDMLLALMAATATPAAGTLMVGDTTHDLDLARNAGVHAIAVACGAHDREGLASRAPLVTLDSIAALRGWLAAHG